MTLTLTQEHLHIGIILLLMGLQIYQWKKIIKANSEIQKIWSQISIWNTMVAMKLLDTQKEIDKLNDKENKDGE